MIFNNFRELIYGNLDMYNGNLSKMIQDFTEILMKLRKSPNSIDVKTCNIKNILNGGTKFYIIEYNYNGNRILCPILNLEFKIHETNKVIMYALQLEYLPPKYKMDLFSKLFDFNETKKVFDLNSVNNDCSAEKGLPISTEAFYNILKTNGNMVYAITAFDVSKILSVSCISTKIAKQMILCDLKPYNVISMTDALKNNDLAFNDNEKQRLREIIDQYIKLIKEYKHDSIEYHKKLSSFERNLKLFKT